MGKRNGKYREAEVFGSDTGWRCRNGGEVNQKQREGGKMRDALKRERERERERERTLFVKANIIMYKGCVMTTIFF